MALLAPSLSSLRRNEEEAGMSLYTLALFLHLSGAIGACVSHGIWLYRACRPGLQRASGQCARLPL
jgi:hypothetical protein